MLYHTGAAIAAYSAPTPMRRLPLRCSVVLVCMVLCTAGFRRLDVPFRFAFDMSRPHLEQLLTQDAAFAHNVTSSQQRHRECDGRCTSVAVAVPLERQVGWHVVQDYAADSRGGLYLRVSQAFEGMFPDVVSCGFALHPNAQGTPYGRARYTWSEILPVFPEAYAAALVRYLFHAGHVSVPSESLRWFWFCASDDFY